MMLDTLATDYSTCTDGEADSDPEDQDFEPDPEPDPQLDASNIDRLALAVLNQQESSDEEMCEVRQQVTHQWRKCPSEKQDCEFIKHEGNKFLFPL